MSQERIVNLAFVTAALLLWYLSASMFAGLFDLVRPEWDLGLIGREFRLSNLLGIVTGIAGGISLWRNAKVFELAQEVAGELRAVTWPSQAEVRLSTVVVMATTVLVSLCLWAFDTVFATLTRFIYGG
jgi:preprotein translocase SecE subunit